MTWSILTPDGSTAAASTGPASIRELKSDLQDAFEAAGHFPISTSAPEFQYAGGKGDTASRTTNGEGGLYYDTETEELLRDTGSAWSRIGINIPAGTEMFFYKSTAPKGWVVDTGPDERFLTCVDSSGGSTAGSSYTVTITNDGSASHTHKAWRYVTSGSYVGFRLWNGTYGSSSDYGALYGGPTSILIWINGVNTGSSYNVMRTYTNDSSPPSHNQDIYMWANNSHTHTYHTLAQHKYAIGLIAEKS